VTGVVLFVITVTGGLVAFLLRRRRESGSTKTSDADALWVQTQALMVQLSKDKDRAEEQRDRLLVLQSGTLLPALGLVNETLVSMKILLADVSQKLDRILAVADTIKGR